MEKMDNLTNHQAEHQLMLDNVYQDDVELLYMDCCLGELLRSR